LDIVTSQLACDVAFRQWADIMTGNARLVEGGWIIEGKGVFFMNYGHGETATVDDQIMLGVDPDTGNSTVKIVRPKAHRKDKGPDTVLATDDTGRQFLLRAGSLKKNRVSSFIKDDFAELTELTHVPLIVDGLQASDHWYVVADLGATPSEIVRQAADFSNACARARTSAGGGQPVKDKENANASRPTYGMDEKGRITKRTTSGGTTEVLELQGFVYKALKEIVCEELRKPKRNGYCVDGMIAPANLLIEIKTGTSAHCIYEAVGQLLLYPDLIGIQGRPEKALLIPDQRPLNPVMAAALDIAGISVFTYNIDDRSKKPRITFPDALIERCKRASE
jgi:hypothetical protein